MKCLECGASHFDAHLYPAGNGQDWKWMCARCLPPEMKEVVATYWYRQEPREVNMILQDEVAMAAIRYLVGNGYTREQAFVAMVKERYVKDGKR